MIWSHLFLATRNGPSFRGQQNIGPDKPGAPRNFRRGNPENSADLHLASSYKENLVIQPGTGCFQDPGTLRFEAPDITGKGVTPNGLGENKESLTQKVTFKHRSAQNVFWKCSKLSLLVFRQQGMRIGMTRKHNPTGGFLYSGIPFRFIPSHPNSWPFPTDNAPRRIDLRICWQMKWKLS